jgi:hypothetical protein
MAKKKGTIGILTGGGDGPGLNPANQARCPDRQQVGIARTGAHQGDRHRALAAARRRRTVGGGSRSASSSQS